MKVVSGCDSTASGIFDLQLLFSIYLHSVYMHSSLPFSPHLELVKVIQAIP